MNAELDHRILGYQGDSADGKLAHIMSVVRDITFLRHLFSPHYTIMQLVQPYTTTLPLLNARYGPGGASKELGRVYRIGMRKALAAGAKEFGKSLVNVGRTARTTLNHDEFWRNELIRGEPDEAQLRDVIDATAASGYGASSGIEAGGISEMDMSFPEKAINRLLNMAKALPEAAEGINRYATAIATYRLARRAGKSHESAVREAALTVEETQGGYGAANNPTFFQTPWMQPATQFRKYSLAYGQLYWKNLARVVGKDPAKRRQAIKAFVGLSATLISLAGVAGLPLVEPLRMAVNVLAAMGLKDDDWEKDEADIQKGIGSLIQWASGSKSLGAALGEAVTHGFTRLANIDTSNTFGADSLLLFGQPKDLDEESTLAWMMKAVIGASGGMLLDSGKALAQGDLEGAIPWPKLIDNLKKAYTLRTQGTVSKKTGDTYHEPFGVADTLVKAAGFKPADEARAFETGTAAQSKQIRETNDQRRTLMAQWRNKSGAERVRFFQEQVRDWNASHRNPDDRIQMQDLMRSVRSKKASDKRLAKAAQYED
jgi:hypothetical protein